MDSGTVWVLIVLIVVAGFTISSVADSMKPKPPRPNMNRFEVMENELERLHNTLEDCSRDNESSVLAEIARINTALAESKDEDKAS